MRKAIRILLSEREDIKVAGKATTLSEAVRKVEELLPDVIVLDLYMADGEKERLPAGPKLIAISFANDDEAKASADGIGASEIAG